MITKELLIEVLGVGKEFKGFQQNEVYVTVEIIEDEKYCHGTNYSIHAIANKCEEWATKQENCFAIVSGKLPDNYFCCVQYKFHWLGTDDFEKYFRAKTKPEAIFKACQWILENKTKEQK
jgi:hypothetical protein